MDENNTLEERICLLIENIAMQGYQVLAGSTFEDMGIDSLTKMEVIMDLEDEFNLMIPDAVSEYIDTVDEMVQYIAKRLEA